MYLIHLDFKVIVTIVNILDIEKMNVDQRQSPIGQIEGRMMHRRECVPNVTSLDIWAKIVGPQHQHLIMDKIKAKNILMVNKWGTKLIKPRERRKKEVEMWQMMLRSPNPVDQGSH